MTKKAKNNEEAIDDICRCAYIVAFGDNKFSEAEEEALGEARAFCRHFIGARKAIEVLQETNDMEKAREHFDAETPLLHDLSGIFNTYLDDVQSALAGVKDPEIYKGVVDRYASKITDPYLQLVTAFAAEHVAGADGFNILEKNTFVKLFDSWKITRQEYRYWLEKYVCPVIYGLSYDESIDIEDYESENDEPEVDEDDIKSLLERLFDNASIEETEQPQADASDLPALFQAVIYNDLEALLDALVNGEDPNQGIELSGINGITPLMLAADRAALEIATALVEHGAEVNAVTEIHGYTPLLWSIKAGNEEIAEFLIEQGANIEPFASGEADWSPLLMAANFCLINIARTLLSKGANPNWHDQAENVPLKFLCNAPETEDSIEMVNLLLDSKADPNLHDEDGFYPIHSAIDHGNVRLTELLLDKGVPVDLCFPEDSEEFGSLLKRACLSVKPEIIQLILSRLKDEQFTEKRIPEFVTLDDAGSPALGHSEGFELIATILRKGFNDDHDFDDIEKSVRLLGERGVKPDLIALCYAFLYPSMASAVIPYCKNELQDLLVTSPQLPLAFTAGLVQSVEDGMRYFDGINELWANAIESMSACGVDVPKDLQLEE